MIFADPGFERCALLCRADEHQRSIHLPDAVFAGHDSAGTAFEYQTIVPDRDGLQVRGFGKAALAIDAGHPVDP